MNRDEIAALWATDFCGHPMDEWVKKVWAGTSTEPPFWVGWTCHRASCQRRVYTLAYLSTGEVVRTERWGYGVGRVGRSRPAAVGREDIHTMWDQRPGGACQHPVAQWVGTVSAGTPDDPPFWAARVCHRDKCQRRAHTMAHLYTGCDTHYGPLKHEPSAMRQWQWRRVG